MGEEKSSNQTQTCPQCGNHCPVDALQCGRGRKYFGMTDDGHGRDHGHGCGHKQLGGLAGLLHQCGRFARHADMGEDELFRALAGEERAALQAALEKLSADWQARFGEEALSRCGHGHHGRDGEKRCHKHEDRGR